MGKSLPKAVILLCIIQVLGCVVGKDQLRIRPQDTTWIQKGETTREEVVAKFGEPTFTGTREGIGQQAQYTLRGEPLPTLQPTPSGPFPQAYRPPAQRMPEAEALEERFWVIYDDQGVVQDFGFGPPPELPRPSPQG